MPHITLNSHKAYPWVTYANISFRGYFIVNGTRYSGDSAISYLEYALSSDTLDTVLGRLNGVFSIIWERPEQICFAVDRLRGLPLFYGVSDELYISDNPYAIADILPQVTLDESAEELFRCTKLYVTGSQTLLSEIRQVQASCYCVYDKTEQTVQEHSYFHMEHSELCFDETTLHAGLHEAYRATGKNLVAALNGRTAVVPLSGGADSRMVLTMLYQENYDKVLCFTYGREGNAEAEISRKVAESFGYPWVMVPYTKQLIASLRNDSATKAYQKYAFAMTSTPHMQDFPAVKTLHEQGAFPDDSVFVPGHSGDMIAGSHITPEFLRESLSRPTFLDTVQEKFFFDSLSQIEWERIAARFPECAPDDLEGMASQSEWFNVQERQAKFIVNSVRAYEFFGYEWLIPLWDNALFEFWKHVPLSLRYQRKLYFGAIGEQKVASTNDETSIKRLAAFVRGIPGMRTLARRGVRVLRYWRSPFYAERWFSATQYLAACFNESPLFDVNTLRCYQMLSDWKQRYALEDMGETKEKRPKLKCK